MSLHSEETHAKLRELIAEDPAGGWDKAWVSKVTPWDAGASQPPLQDLFQSDEMAFPKAGRALVPGCGKGYDAINIAKYLGLQVTGLDISPTAVELAKDILKSHPSLSSKVTIENEDFFKLEDEPTFDLVSDYTFFQALPPALRTAWGTKIRNVVKPNGLLVILAFPTDTSKDTGPPFGIDDDTHADILGDGWTKLLDRVPSTSSEIHMGRDRLIVFQKSSKQ